MATKKRTSGPTRTYAERSKSGITRVSAELDRATLGKLDVLREDSGMSRADQIRAMIDAGWEEWVAFQRSLGRVIHHIDGNPRNNKPANLRIIDAGENRKR